MLMKIIFTILLSGYMYAGLLAQTDSHVNVIIILDASGSMWAKMDNSTRIQQAKSVLGNMANKMPVDAQVGLMAYGHTNAADCDDSSKH